MPTARIPKKLKPLFTKKKRFKVAIGGRGSGKSMGFADGFIMKAQTEGAKVLCGREFQNSIDDSVYGLLAAEIERLQVPGFDVQASRIDSATGGGMRFRGLARNTESIKSLYGFKYYWGEEAQTMSAESIKLLTPSIREEDSELWFSANPRSSADPFSQRFIVPFQDELAKHGYYEDDQHLIVVINWRDNPWFPAELEAERKWDYENLPRAVYDHVWEGAFNDTVDNAIIKPEWFDAAIDAHKLDKLKEAFKPKGAKIASHDPFNGGRDAAGYVLRHGSIILKASSKLTGEIDEACDWATDQAIKDGADWFVWDGDGMGTGLKRQVSTAFEGKATRYHMFRGSLSGTGQDNAQAIYQPEAGDRDTKPKTHAETFKNNRSQYYSKIAYRFYNTYKCVIRGEYIDPDEMISLDSEGIEDMAMLRSELCRIPLKPVNNGLIQIMSKEDMKRLLKIESPNLADSCMMSIANPNTSMDMAPIQFETWA